jgi:hypothetical protein
MLSAALPLFRFSLIRLFRRCRHYAAVAFRRFAFISFRYFLRLRFHDAS